MTAAAPKPGAAACFCKEVSMKESNYDITLRRMPGEFLKYDQQRMLRNFRLEHDADALYLPMLERRYRVDRRSGCISWTVDGQSWTPGGFNDSMTIYDLLCCAKDGCRLSGRYSRAENLRGAAFGADPARGLFDAFAARCDRAPEKLACACAALGGTRMEMGELSYQLPLFPFLPVILQFWSSDDEFPPSFKLMWDENTLDFLKFETVCYAATFLTERLGAKMDRL